jgi:uncharacterized membrane protein
MVFMIMGGKKEEKEDRFRRRSRLWEITNERPAKGKAGKKLRLKEEKGHLRRRLLVLLWVFV